MLLHNNEASNKYLLTSSLPIIIARDSRILNCEIMSQHGTGFQPDWWRLMNIADTAQIILGLPVGWVFGGCQNKNTKKYLKLKFLLKNFDKFKNFLKIWKFNSTFFSSHPQANTPSATTLRPCTELYWADYARLAASPITSSEKFRRKSTSANRTSSRRRMMTTTSFSLMTPKNKLCALLLAFHFCRSFWKYSEDT